MRRATSAVRFICALALTVGLGWPPPALEAGPLDLPPATGISPGDILIYDSFNDWLKFDPVSDQLFSLPWDDRFFSSVERFVLDLDGSILTVNSSLGRSLERIHPITGLVTTLRPSFPSVGDLEILPNGDLLAAIPGSGALLRYSRQTGTLTALPKPPQFSPYSIAVTHTGDTYILDNFRGLQQVDLTTGTLTDVAGAELEQTWGSLKVLPDGDLAYAKANGIYRFDPSTGVESLLSGPFRGDRLATDEFGNVWASNFNGLHFIDGVTGESTLRLAQPSFFSPHIMLVVPSDWTPPPVPEPSSIALSALGLMCTWRRMSWSRSKRRSAA